MKLVIQRVSEANVTVEETCISSIQKGYLILLGIEPSDTAETVLKYVRKLINLRIFADAEGKTNLSIQDVNGELLIVSQFTLYANCKKGNRPNFIQAAPPQQAETLYKYFIEECKKYISNVKTGIFGADMKVSLTNDGPFTIILEDL